MASFAGADPCCIALLYPQKCGTTALAEHLRRHPALSGVDGLPYNDTLTKESHFFQGGVRYMP